MTITGDFERFQYLNFENNFSENLKHFLKKLEFCFLAQNTTNRSTTFHIKLPCKMPMLKRQNEWETQNGPITKNVLSSLNTSFFCNLSIRTSYK